MNKLLTFALLSLVICTPVFARQRAASPYGNQIDLNGVVVDFNSGAPVVGATVTALALSAETDSSGQFTLTLPAYSPITINVSRSGYDTSNVTVTPSTVNGTYQVRLHSRSTVAVQLSDGSTVQLDDDSVVFAFAQPMYSVIAGPVLKLCPVTGTQVGKEVNADRAEIARIIGPAHSGAASACCPHDSWLVDMQMKNGDQFRASITFGCWGYDVYIRGNDHTTHQTVYESVAEFSPQGRPTVTQVTFP